MKAQLLKLSIALGLSTTIYAAPCDCEKTCQGCGEEGGGGGTCMISDAVPADAPKPGAITAAQREQLLILHEEERLARDVYRKLGTKYPLNPFKNIPRSEENHMAATAELLTYHGIPVPDAREPGVYDSKSLNKLYRRLVKRGMKSEIDALRVGALVEETDIRDLRKMAAAPPSVVAKNLSQQLENASYNHLRAFVRNLSARGIEYDPEILTSAELTKIVGETGAGKGRGRGRGFRGGR